MKKCDKNEIQEIIKQITEIRRKYDVFKDSEREIHLNLCIAIRALKITIGEIVEE